MSTTYWLILVTTATILTFYRRYVNKNANEMVEIQNTNLTHSWTKFRIQKLNICSLWNIVKQNLVWNNLNSLFWTKSLNTKTFGVDLTVETTGNIYNCVIYKKEWDIWNQLPKTGQNRDTKGGMGKCWSLHRGSSDHSQSLWIHLWSWSSEASCHRRHSFVLAVYKSWHYHLLLWISLRNLRQAGRSAHPFNHCPCRRFSILPLWVVVNNLGSLFIDLRCQVIFDVSHVSNLVLHHCRWHHMLS